MSYKENLYIYSFLEMYFSFTFNRKIIHITTLKFYLLGCLAGF